MAFYTIPIENAAEDGAFFFTVTLDGIDYRLEFQSNAREDFWYFDIFDLEGERIRSGVKVVANYPLLRLCRQAIKPAGSLMCIDTTSEPDDPGLEDLGENSIFTYVSAASLP